MFSGNCALANNYQHLLLKLKLRLPCQPDPGNYSPQFSGIIVCIKLSFQIQSNIKFSFINSYPFGPTKPYLLPCAIVRDAFTNKSFPRAAILNFSIQNFILKRNYAECNLDRDFCIENKLQNIVYCYYYYYHSALSKILN